MCTKRKTVRLGGRRSSTRVACAGNKASEQLGQHLARVPGAPHAGVGDEARTSGGLVAAAGCIIVSSLAAPEQRRRQDGVDEGTSTSSAGGITVGLGGLPLGGKGIALEVHLVEKA